MARIYESDELIKRVNPADYAEKDIDSMIKDETDKLRAQMNNTVALIEECVRDNMPDVIRCFGYTDVSVIIEHFHPDNILYEYKTFDALELTFDYIVRLFRGSRDDRDYIAFRCSADILNGGHAKVTMFNSDVDVSDDERISVITCALTAKSFHQVFIDLYGKYMTPLFEQVINTAAAENCKTMIVDSRHHLLYDARVARLIAGMEQALHTEYADTELYLVYSDDIGIDGVFGTAAGGLWFYDYVFTWTQGPRLTYKKISAEVRKFTDRSRYENEIPGKYTPIKGSDIVWSGWMPDSENPLRVTAFMDELKKKRAEYARKKK